MESNRRDRDNRDTNRRNNQDRNQRGQMDQNRGDVSNQDLGSNRENIGENTPGGLQQNPQKGDVQQRSDSDRFPGQGDEGRGRDRDR